MDRRSFLTTAALGLSALALKDLTLPRFSQAAGKHRLLWMGWDGAGWNNVAPMMAQGLLPNLSALAAQGCAIPLGHNCATSTVPAFAVQFTGLLPNVTGIHGGLYYKGWEIQNPKDQKFWIQQLPESLSIYYKLKRQKIKLGHFISKWYLGRGFRTPPLEKMANLAHDYLLWSPKDEGLEDQYAYLLRDATYAFLSANTGNCLAFLHLDPDYFGHVWGENGARYLQEFQRCDEILGFFLTQQKALGINILVTTDHGFNKGTFAHPSAPDVWLATDLPLNPRCLPDGWGAEMRDIPKTIMRFFHLTDNIHPEAGGKSLLAG